MNLNLERFLHIFFSFVPLAHLNTQTPAASSPAAETASLGLSVNFDPALSKTLNHNCFILWMGH